MDEKRLTREIYRGHFGHRPSAAFVQPVISIPFPLTSASAILRRASCRSRHAVLRETPSFSAASSCSSPSRSISRISSISSGCNEMTLSLFLGTAAGLVAAGFRSAGDGAPEPWPSPAGTLSHLIGFIRCHFLLLIIGCIRNSITCLSVLPDEFFDDR